MSLYKLNMKGRKKDRQMDRQKKPLKNMTLIRYFCEISDKMQKESGQLFIQALHN